MRFPAFMFWPERYWFDAYDLTDAQHGIYLRLLIVQWNTPACRIPNDNLWISGKMGRSVEAVENEVRPIIQRFFKSDGNWVWQNKLFEEFCRLKRLSKRGTDANKSRWGKNKDVSQTDPSGINQGVGPTPTPTKKEITNSARGNGLGKKGALNGSERVTIADPKKRLGLFMGKLAAHIQNDAPNISDYGWAMVLAATDATSERHHDCLKRCIDAAHQIGKGWPRNWPTDGKFFEVQHAEG